MQTVPFYLLLKLRVHNSGLGGGRQGYQHILIKAQFPFCTVLVLVLERDQKGILWKVVSEAHSFYLC